MACSNVTKPHTALRIFRTNAIKQFQRTSLYTVCHHKSHLVGLLQQNHLVRVLHLQTPGLTTTQVSGGQESFFFFFLQNPPGEFSSVDGIFPFTMNLPFIDFLDLFFFWCCASSSLVICSLVFPSFFVPHLACHVCSFVFWTFYRVALFPPFLSHIL